MDEISIIIPTKNRQTFLLRCLESIFKQDINVVRFEVFVIDNGSTDSTRIVVEKFSNQKRNIHYFYNSIPGLHIGRHIGLQYSKFKWLAFLDDDVILDDNWFNSLFSTEFNHNETKLIASRVLPMYEINPPSWLSRTWEKNKNIFELSIIDLGDFSNTVSPYSVYGCCFIVEKSFLFEIDGFHPDAMPWEKIAYRGDGESYVSAMALKKNYLTIYNPQIITYHWVSKNRMNFKYFCKRHFIQGISECFTQIRSSSIPQKYPIDFIPSKSILIEFKKILYKIFTFSSDFKVREFIYLIANKIGFIYLKYKFTHDSKVKKWVLKKNYLK